MFRKTITAAVLAVGAVTISAGPALAVMHLIDITVPELPGPGVLGLITIGIIGAIVIAKLWRRK